MASVDFLKPKKLNVLIFIVLAIITFVIPVFYAPDRIPVAGPVLFWCLSIPELQYCVDIPPSDSGPVDGIDASDIAQSCTAYPCMILLILYDYILACLITFAIMKFGTKTQESVAQTPVQNS